MSEPPMDDDLERRVRALELALSPKPFAQRPARRSPAGRLLVILAAAFTLATLPMMAVASDRFSDVSDSHAFHDEINELWGARITRGCATNPRRYCPDEAVSRGQMAGFLSRGLGRVTWDEGGPPTNTNAVASVTVDAPGVPGGTAYVVVVAEVFASTEVAPSEEASPSLVMFAVEKAPTPFYDHEADEVGWDAAFNLFGPGAPIFEGGAGDALYARASKSTTEVFAVPSGESTVLDLVVHREHIDPASNIEIYGKLTALYVPFGEGGP
jgi:hypothetical protein